MSSAAPAIPLFGDAYLADTFHLTLEEHGAYLKLLMIAWRMEGCALPNDDTRLAQMLGVSKAKWAKLKPVVLAFWTLTETGWTHSGRATQSLKREHISMFVRRAVLERDGERCVYCGTIDGPFHLDHRLPWSRGGRDTVENLVVACEPCNRAKADKTVEEWLA